MREITRYAPVALFVYRRPEHTRRTIEALQANPEARESKLIVFADAARDRGTEKDVETVRRYVRSVPGFGSITVVEQGRNRGLAGSIIAGVTEVLSEHDRVIVLEDDLVTSHHFLRYMNEALEYYRDDERVVSIHGYVYPTGKPLPETFFLRGADCWGWATWRRAWALFNPDGRKLLRELKRRHLTRQFDINGAYPFTRMLEHQVAGVNDSWAIRWHASTFLQEKLTLYPGRALVRNIGNDRSGTHGGGTSRFDVELSDRPVRIGGVPVEESITARLAFEEFLRRRRDWVGRLRRLAKAWLPPKAVRLIQRWGRGAFGGLKFAGAFANWDEAAAAATGYDSPAILEKVRMATQRVRRGEAAYERDSVLFDRSEYSWPVIAALMSAAASSNGRLSVLDFGGSLGSTYFQHRRLLEGVRQVCWGVVEQPHFVAVGRREVADDNLQFFATIAECSELLQPNVILLGSVLQYLRDPYAILRELAGTPATVMIIDRTPLTDFPDDRITIQRVPPAIYDASYPCWILSREKLRTVLSSWNVVASFVSPEGTMRTDAGVEFTFEGLILAR